MQFWLLAKVNDLAKKDEAAPSSLGDYWFLLVVVVSIAALGAGLLYWDRQRKRVQHRPKPPRSVFQELCEAHFLGETEIALLRKAATSKDMPQPALLFVDRRLLGGLAAGTQPDAGDYSQLATKLFGPNGK